MADDLGVLPPGVARSPGPSTRERILADGWNAPVALIADALAPNMDPGLGAVYDQDTGNLEMRYRGFRASWKRGETLGDYREARIRAFHQTIDKYLAK